MSSLFIGQPCRLSSDIGEQLGCATKAVPFESSFIVDETKATHVADVHAGGDVTRIGHTVTFACADGGMAALAIHRSLVFGTDA